MEREHKCTDTCHQIMDHYPHVVDKHHAKTKDYKPKEQIVMPDKLDDLDEVPFYLRDVI